MGNQAVDRENGTGTKAVDGNLPENNKRQEDVNTPERVQQKGHISTGIGTQSANENVAGE